MRLHAHARQRMLERGASEDEVAATIRGGERFPAKFGREGFRRNFRFDGVWQERRYAMKPVEAIATYEYGDWLAISAIVKYF